MWESENLRKMIFVSSWLKQPDTANGVATERGVSINLVNDTNPAIEDDIVVCSRELKVIQAPVTGFLIYDSRSSRDIGMYAPSQC
jgi:hypothetical protein